MQKWFEYVAQNPRTTVMGVIGLIGVVNHLLDNPHVWNNQDELADAIMVAIGCIGSILGRDWGRPRK